MSSELIFLHGLPLMFDLWQVEHLQLEPNLITHNAAISACQGGKDFIAGQLYCKSSSSHRF